QSDMAIKKFNLMRDLANTGYVSAAPGDTGQNDALIGAAVNITPENRRPLLNVPGVGAYRAPSRMDQYGRAKELARQKGEEAGIQEQAELATSDPKGTRGSHY